MCALSSEAIKKDFEAYAFHPLYQETAKYNCITYSKIKFFSVCLGNNDSHAIPTPPRSAVLDGIRSAGCFSSKAAVHIALIPCRV